MDERLTQKAVMISILPITLQSTPNLQFNAFNGTSSDPSSLPPSLPPSQLDIAASVVLIQHPVHLLSQFNNVVNKHC
jgi:hypothetical protein